MDDRQRIEALVAEGRITREEADELLRALDDIDGLEEELEGPRASAADYESAPGPTWTPAVSPVPPVPPAPPFAGARTRTADSPSGGATGRVPGGEHRGAGEELPAGHRWLEVKILAGDLDIEVSDEVDAPTTSSHGPGGTELKSTPRGWRLTAESGFDDDSLLGRIVRRVAPMDTKVIIPTGTAVRLQMTAGDVNIRGPVTYLVGNMVAGDLNVEETHGLDLTVRAGDVDVAVRLTEGRHRLASVAGDLNVRILPASDVTVRGTVNIGELTVPGEWERRGRGLASSFERRLGSGTAELSIQLGTGDLEVGEGRA